MIKEKFQETCEKIADDNLASYIIQANGNVPVGHMVLLEQLFLQGAIQGGVAMLDELADQPESVYRPLEDWEKKLIEQQEGGIISEPTPKVETSHFLFNVTFCLLVFIGCLTLYFTLR